MKSVLTSIQPYWVFLIIAKAMGWNYPQEKTVEVRKTFPKDENWNRVVEIYCTKDKKSFNRIPKEYQPLMKELLGKVVGEFVCDSIITIQYQKSGYGLDNGAINGIVAKSCIQEKELYHYLQGKIPYLWHISKLKIYDKPKELSEFRKPCNHYCEKCGCLDIAEMGAYEHTFTVSACTNILTRPPQSWCYIEEEIK